MSNPTFSTMIVLEQWRILRTKTHVCPASNDSNSNSHSKSSNNNNNNDRDRNSNNINSKRNGNRNDITIVSIMSETILAQEAVGV